MFLAEILARRSADGIKITVYALASSVKKQVWPLTGY
jgi:hypothetical protein